MKVEQEKSSFKPVTITLETKEEFAKVYYELGNLSCFDSPMLGKIYDKFHDVKTNE